MSLQELSCPTSLYEMIGYFDKRKIDTDKSSCMIQIYCLINSTSLDFGEGQESDKSYFM